MKDNRLKIDMGTYYILVDSDGNIEPKVKPMWKAVIKTTFGSFWFWVAVAGCFLIGFGIGLMVTS